MPTKVLDSQAGRNGVQKTFKFGGGSNEIRAEDDGTSAYSYIINAGGGDDMIFGSDFTTRFGTGTMVDDRTTNGDLLIGGMGSDTIVGGAGDDWIYGGNEDGSDGGKGKAPIVTNILYGEQGFVYLSYDETFTGGDDVITAGNDVRNFLYGDIQSANGVDATSVFNFGDDTLIGGTGEDDFIGDSSSSGGTKTINGGADTFVIAPDGGKDTIIDFHTADGDKVDLTAFEFANYDALDGLWYSNFGFQALDFDGDGDGFGNVLIFVGIAFNADPDAIVGLGAGDFVFV